MPPFTAREASAGLLGACACRSIRGHNHSHVMRSSTTLTASRRVASRPLVHIRASRASDLPTIVQIYNEGIRERNASFEVTERTVRDVEPWIDPAYPLLVAETHGMNPSRILGWVRAAPHSPRTCYRGIGEYSVYVAAASRGRGVGDALMTEFVPACARAGFWKILGRVFPENAASRALCARHGFRELGIFAKHARLEGQWRDVIVVERLIPENLT